MPRPLPFGLTEPQRDCLIEAVRAGMLVPGADGRYRRCLAFDHSRSFQGRVVASLVKRGLAERFGPNARAVQPSREGAALAKAVLQHEPCASQPMKRPRAA